MAWSIGKEKKEISSKLHQMWVLSVLERKLGPQPRNEQSFFWRGLDGGQQLFVNIKLGNLAGIVDFVLLK